MQDFGFGSYSEIGCVAYFTVEDSAGVEFEIAAAGEAGGGGRAGAVDGADYFGVS